jgi:hypothetical protein
MDCAGKDKKSNNIFVLGNILETMSFEERAVNT